MNSYYDLEQKLSGAMEMLQAIVCEKLDNFGVYYRAFARIKSGASIEQKLAQERYIQNPERKISDLFGIRLTLYFQDDAEVCKKILENMLINVRWKSSQNGSNTFDAITNNGTFTLPGFVKKMVEPEIEGLRIEPTLEVQIRTVFFEGWHEAEHDMRYKSLHVWEQFPKESRKLNSILATLEMCDHYMVDLYDDMGHDFYKKDEWGQMIRYKYRFKTVNGDLDEGLLKLMTPGLAKQIFKMSKASFMDLLLESGFTSLDTNTIVFLVNESNVDKEYYIPEIREEFFAIRRKNHAPRETYFEKKIVPLASERAFDSVVRLICDDSNRHEVFKKAVDTVYEMMLQKDLEDIFPEELSRPLHPVKKKTQGVNCRFKYDEENCRLKCNLTHVGLDEPGKVWNVTVQVWPDDDKNLYLHVNNTYSRPENSAMEVIRYSRPRIYNEIARVCGIEDVEELTMDIRNVADIGVVRFLELIHSNRRFLPVILITLPDEADLGNEDSCYGRLIDVNTNPKAIFANNLMRKVGYVCHVYYATGKEAQDIAMALGEDAKLYQNGVRFFSSGYEPGRIARDNYVSYTESQIWNKPKDLYALRTKEPHFYQVVTGPDAVRHEIIQSVYAHILNK